VKRPTERRPHAPLRHRAAGCSVQQSRRRPRAVRGLSHLQLDLVLWCPPWRLPRCATSRPARNGEVTSVLQPASAPRSARRVVEASPHDYSRMAELLTGYASLRRQAVDGLLDHRGFLVVAPRKGQRLTPGRTDRRRVPCLPRAGYARDEDRPRTCRCPSSAGRGPHGHRTACGFLNRVPQVRILPGAPRTWETPSDQPISRQLVVESVVSLPRAPRGVHAIRAAQERRAAASSDIRFTEAGDR
jgi:hypothetical protein